MPPFRPYRRVLPAAFPDANGLHWDAPMQALPYIGPWYAARLGQQAHVYTLRDWVRHVVARLQQVPNATAPQRRALVRDLVGALTRNQAPHTCRSGYLVRPINRMAFNALVEVLALARDRPPPGLLNVNLLPPRLEAALICEFNQGLPRRPQAQQAPGAPICQAGGGRGSVGGSHAVWEMRHCPCLTTPDQCEANPAHRCQWLPQHGCISRTARMDRSRAANDVGNFAGDWDTATTVPRANERFVPIPPGGGPGRQGRLFALPLAQLGGPLPPAPAAGGDDDQSSVTSDDSPSGPARRTRQRRRRRRPRTPVARQSHQLRSGRQY